MGKDRRRCRQCGAELRLGPTACPLCGANLDAPAPTKPSEIAGYQADLRKLRAELKRLRRDGQRAS